MASKVSTQPGTVKHPTLKADGTERKPRTPAPEYDLSAFQVEVSTAPVVQTRTSGQDLTGYIAYLKQSWNNRTKRETAKGTREDGVPLNLKGIPSEEVAKHVKSSLSRAAMQIDGVGVKSQIIHNDDDTYTVRFQTTTRKGAELAAE